MAADEEREANNIEGTGDIEKSPKQMRQAKIYIFVVIGVLVLALIFDTFRRAGHEESKKKEVEQTEQAPVVKQDRSFDTIFNQEVERLKTQGKQQPAAEKETTKQAIERLQAQKALMEQPRDQLQKSGEIDIYKEWKDQEKRRALNARTSAFKMKKANSALDEAERNIVQPAAAEQNKFDVIDQEKNRVIQEIQRLNKLQQDGGTSVGAGSIPQALMPGFLKEAKAAQPEDQYIVGKPASEQAPKEGQKLISTGTVINAALDQTLMSDYQGSYRGRITHDVYDVTGTSILIPKGCVFVGKCLRIQNVNEPIQARMGLTVRWVVLPNGKRISFEKRADVLDQAGIHAVKDKVNYHFFAQFLGVAAYALLSSETSREGSGYANDQTYEGQVGESLREQFAPLAAKYLNLVPTITLRAGEPIKIFLEDDVYADQWAPLHRRLIRANQSTY